MKMKVVVFFLPFKKDLGTNLGWRLQLRITSSLACPTQTKSGEEDW